MEEGVELGYDTYTVPFGTDTISAIYALGFATRSALTFGGMEARPWRATSCSTTRTASSPSCWPWARWTTSSTPPRPAPSTSASRSSPTRASRRSCPPASPPTSTSSRMPFDEIEGADDLERAEKLVQRCIEVRGVKVKIAKVPIPVPYGSAFEGERVRKDDMRVEFGGKRIARLRVPAHAAGWTRSRTARSRSIGPDFDDDRGRRGHAPGHRRRGGRPQDAEGLRAGARAPDPPLRQRRRGHPAHRPARHRLDPHQQERRRQGLPPASTSARSSTRASTTTSATSSTRCRCTSSPTRPRSTSWLEVAREAYDERNDRLANLTDETRGRVLLLHAVPELRAQPRLRRHPGAPRACAAPTTGSTARRRFEINPTGPNQPIPKGVMHRPGQGRVRRAPTSSSTSTRTRRSSSVTVYSIMENPMTACGCFECIVVLIPEANGVMIVSREDPSMTPAA